MVERLMTVEEYGLALKFLGLRSSDVAGVFGVDQSATTLWKKRGIPNRVAEYLLEQVRLQANFVLRNLGSVPGEVMRGDGCMRDALVWGMSFGRVGE